MEVPNAPLKLLILSAINFDFPGTIPQVEMRVKLTSSLLRETSFRNT